MRQSSPRLFYPETRHTWCAATPASASLVSPDTVDRVFGAIQAHLTQRNYPCVAALRALAHRDYAVGIYGALGEDTLARQVRADVCTFIAEQEATRSQLRSFWAVFPDTPLRDEDTFELDLWRQLSALTSEAQRDDDWPDAAEKDPDAKRFLFCIEKRPLFVVGLHPQSSRRSRRFPMAALIFNLFDQFDSLPRDEYHAMVATNRQRDERFDGGVNPMVAAHGDDWETIQYSGRINPPDWKCPFHFRAKVP